MKNKILLLCKRLDKSDIDKIETISEIEQSELLPILDELIKENKLKLNAGVYSFITNTQHQKKPKLPLFFQFHDKQTIDYIIRGFWADIEAKKMMVIFDTSKHVTNKFYQYLRIAIYENQLRELKELFEKNPKIPQERIYMNTKAYLYLYNHKLYVSEKYLISKDSKKHTDDERLEIKNIYLRSYRKVLSRSFEHKFYLHLAEELWKYGKEFNERNNTINKILFA